MENRGRRTAYFTRSSRNSFGDGRMFGRRHANNRSSPRRPFAWVTVTGEPLTPQKTFNK